MVVMGRNYYSIWAKAHRHRDARCTCVPAQDVGMWLRLQQSVKDNTSAYPYGESYSMVNR
jgi:hypothetical protein